MQEKPQNVLFEIKCQIQVLLNGYLLKLGIVKSHFVELNSVESKGS